MSESSTNLEFQSTTSSLLHDGWTLAFVSQNHWTADELGETVLAFPLYNSAKFVRS